MRPERARRGAMFAVAAPLSAFVALAGCIIADSPGALPTLPLEPPVILPSLVPPRDEILTSFPGEFVLPIYLEDPSQKIFWRAFTDFNPSSGDTRAGAGESDPDPQSADGGVRTLEISVTQPADLSACHTIQIIVAYGFLTSVAGSPAYATPGAGGSDSVQWVYAPNGAANCPEFDAGPSDSGSSATGDGDAD